MGTYGIQKTSGIKLFLRSLLPSAASIVCSLAATVGIVGFHLLVLSRDASLFLPRVAGSSNEQLARLYAANIVEPIDKAFANSVFGALSSAFLWGLVGWGIYAFADFVLTTARELHQSDTNIQLPLKNQVIQHPLHRQAIVRMLWRLMVSLLFLVATFALLPVLSWLFKMDVRIVQSENFLDMLKLIGMVVLGWLGVFHVYVVLFRLFLLRTRVFGELIY